MREKNEVPGIHSSAAQPESAKKRPNGIGIVRSRFHVPLRVVIKGRIDGFGDGWVFL
jgi:hypothetical protein